MAFKWVLSTCLVLSTVGQMVGQSLTSSQLQQCTANLACSIDYSNIFQAKLDNATRYLELELALLRQQTNNILVPVETQLSQLQLNHTHEITVLNQALARAVADVSHDREILVNITRGLYTLNDDFHKENMVRYQDVHKLMVELNEARNNISSLSSIVNALLTQSVNGTVAAQVIAAAGSGVSSIGGTTSGCVAKDAELTDVRNNLTYYLNAFTSSQKALENVRALESFLQSQVVELKANLSRAESVNHIKDNLIVSLQSQLKAALANSITPSGTCSADLGMKSGAIPSSAVSASAAQAGYEPTHARLDDGQGWYTPERTNSQDFLQIDTGSLHFISKVATQGAPCCDVMVTNYTLQYSSDGVKWQEYKKDCQMQYLSGNVDSKTVVEHPLDTPVVARYVRFNVIDFKKDGVSNYVGMRVELYGCNK